jgi:hypothetical protein
MQTYPSDEMTSPLEKKIKLYNKKMGFGKIRNFYFIFTFWGAFVTETVFQFLN